MMPSTSAHSGQSNAGIFRTKKLFKDNSSYHNYIRLANRGEVVDKALVTLKFELPSNSGRRHMHVPFHGINLRANFPKGHFHVGLPRRR